MKMELCNKINYKQNNQIFFLTLFIVILVLVKMCSSSNKINSNDLNKTDTSSKKGNNKILLRNSKNDPSQKTIKNEIQVNFIKNTNKKNLLKNEDNKKSKSYTNKNHKKIFNNRLLKKYNLQKKISHELKVLNTFDKFLARNKSIMKRLFRKNKTFSVIKTCGLKLLTEIYCQYYKKNYSEKLDECRKLKFEDFKNRCSNKKSLYVIYNLKSAMNAYESYNQNYKIVGNLSDLSNVQVAIRSIIFKNLFNDMLGPIQKCKEIPINIRLGIIKQKRRFTYNDKNLKGLNAKKRINEYYLLFEKIKMLFNDLTRDLSGIKPREEKIVCVGYEKAAERIVNHFIKNESLK